LKRENGLRQNKNHASLDQEKKADLEADTAEGLDQEKAEDTDLGQEEKGISAEKDEALAGIGQTEVLAEREALGRTDQTEALKAEEKIEALGTTLAKDAIIEGLDQEEKETLAEEGKRKNQKLR